MLGRHARRLALLGILVGCMASHAEQSTGCYCYVNLPPPCYEYYGDATGDPYCNYSYMNYYWPTGGYYPVYFETLEPTTVPHPDPSVPAKASDETVQAVSVLYIARRDEVAGGTDPTPTRELGEDYPCGTLADEFQVVCTDTAGSTMDEDYLVLAFAARREDIPRDDDPDTLLITFAFQRDTDPNNDFVPEPARANDYAGGTDKWYVATRRPEFGWSLEVYESTGTELLPVSSDARVIVQRDTAVLAVPAREFEVDVPAARFSLFRHDGSLGLEGGDWSGFVHPPLDADLIKP